MNWKTYIGLLAAIAVIVVGALSLWPTSEPIREPGQTDAADAETHRPRPPAPRQRRGRPGDDRREEGASGPDDPELARVEDDRHDERSPEQDPTSPAHGTDEPGSETTETTPVELPDVGFDAEDHRPWKDPTNQRVLGDKRWMAPISDEEEERIDEIFEKARAARQDPGLSNFDRRLSIETAREIVDACFADLRDRQPGIRGRIIVGWTTGAAMGTGWIRNPRIVTNVHLEDATFEGCILQGLGDASYPADDGNAIEVEYPFFYGR